MEPTQSAISFNFANLLDLNRWTVEQGCYFLTVYKRNFSTKEVEYLNRKITSHEKKSPERSFSFMQAFAQEIIEGKSVIEDASAFIEFTRIYRIAATKFDINKPVTPYQFIAWAIDKRTIPVHEELLQWREEERDKSPTGRTSAMRREIKKTQARIAELETELAACREQLEEARRENSGKEEHETAHGEDFPAEYDGHGLCSLVIRMRKEGKTEKEIAATLHGSGKWCSASQIGALLHRGGRVSADAMLKHAQRLLGKA